MISFFSGQKTPWVMWWAVVIGFALYFNSCAGLRTAQSEIDVNEAVTALLDVDTPGVVAPVVGVVLDWLCPGGFEALVDMSIIDEVARLTAVGCTITAQRQVTAITAGAPVHQDMTPGATETVVDATDDRGWVDRNRRLILIWAVVIALASLAAVMIVKAVEVAKQGNDAQDDLVEEQRRNFREGAV